MENTFKVGDLVSVEFLGEITGITKNYKGEIEFMVKTEKPQGFFTGSDVYLVQAPQPEDLKPKFKLDPEEYSPESED